MKFLKIFSFILFLQAFEFVELKACNLVNHDWQRLFLFETLLEVPVFPAGEVDILSNMNIPPDPVNVFWLVNNPSKLLPAMLMMPVCQKKEFKINWLPVSSKKSSMLNMVKRNYENATSSIILSSNSIKFKAALFHDLNSSWLCYKFVLAQDNRIRALSLIKNHEAAEELNSTVCVSISFYRFPIPGHIFLIDFYPDTKTRINLYDSPSLVEKLLVAGFLKPFFDLRPASELPDFPALK
ncbi:MAG: hypothetical protein HQM10_17715 [Candidatus Riflebacteria bacterium]|nr:hypothetical protein [Candidatus Riflebacteria bacterium]